MRRTVAGGDRCPLSPPETGYPPGGVEYQTRNWHQGKLASLVSNALTDSEIALFATRSHGDDTRIYRELHSRSATIALSSSRPPAVGFYSLVCSVVDLNLRWATVSALFAQERAVPGVGQRPNDAAQ